MYLGGGTIQLTCNVSLMNPSQVSIANAGQVQFDVLFQGVRVVTVTVANFTFNQGWNTYDSGCTGIVWSPLLKSPTDEEGLEAMAKLQRFLSDYIDGFSNEVQMVGNILQPDGTYKPGTDMPLLQPAFQNFATNITVPGQPLPFITALQVYLDWQSATKIIENGGGIIPARAHLYNPFSTPLTITHLNLTVKAGNLSAPIGGWLSGQLGMLPIYVPGYSSMLSGSMAVYLIWDATVAATVLEILFGPTHQAPVSALGSMEVWIGASGPGQPDPRVTFNQSFSAVQESVPTTLGNLTMADWVENGGDPEFAASFMTPSALSDEEAKRFVLDSIQKMLNPPPAPQQEEAVLEGSSFDMENVLRSLDNMRRNLPVVRQEGREGLDAEVQEPNQLDSASEFGDEVWIEAEVDVQIPPQPAWVEVERPMPLT
jgi:hypothetical protein